MGHLSLGYLFAKASSKALKVDVNLPLVLFLSLLPDIDLFVPWLQHRGITHSLLFLLVIFAPVFIVYRKRAVPYFLATAQHSLVGDISGSLMLFWPLSRQWYGLGIEITSLPSLLLEWTCFIIAFFLMLKTKDLWNLLKPNVSNLFLAGPLVAVIVSMFLVAWDLVLPEMIIPHLVYLAIFSFSILKTPILKVSRE